MSKPLIVRVAAEADITAARLWYEQQRDGLGVEFLDAVEAVLDRLEAVPEMHQVIWQNVRRAKLKRFPYLVYYRVLADRTEVLAVMHGRRHPSAWKSRVD